MTRQCGGCTLCCKLVPVRELGKPAGQRCQHQRHGKGCSIYARRPISCRTWSCRWLVEDDTAELSRPDRSRYAIDIMPDFVTLQNNETGEETHVPVVQVWVDPFFPDAHEDATLRAYMMRRGAEGMATMIRYSSEDGFTIFPPNMASDGQWHDSRGFQNRRTVERQPGDLQKAGFKVTVVMKEEP
jgi:hypothetical protein